MFEMKAETRVLYLQNVLRQNFEFKKERLIVVFF